MPTRNSPSPLLRLSVRAADAGIELAAESVLRRCAQALGLDRVPLPVPIEAWIERPLGLRFGVAAVAELGEGVLGKATPSTGEIVVSEALLEHEARFRFTCAHELGHLILHGKQDAAFRDAELPHTTDAPAVEHEADRFAAAVLVPVATLAEQIEAARRAARLAPQTVAMLRGDDALTVWLWRRRLLPALCARYDVSRAAMVYRLREVRLPGKRRLVKPSIVPLLVAPERVLADLQLDAIAIDKGVPRYA